MCVCLSPILRGLRGGYSKSVGVSGLWAIFVISVSFKIKVFCNTEIRSKQRNKVHLSIVQSTGASGWEREVGKFLYCDDK